MSKNIFCVFLMVFSLSINVALAGMEYPQEMMEVSSPYPGAIIAQTINASGTVMVTMESNHNLDSISEFYKNKLLAAQFGPQSQLKPSHRGIQDLWVKKD